MHLKLLFLSLLLILIACDKIPSSNEDAQEQKPPARNESNRQEIGKTINDSLDSIKSELKKLQPHADQFSGQAKDEVEKLYTFEYTVKSFASDLSDLELEQELVSLGQQRWDCFDMVLVNNKIRVFCKKLPKTFLRYIPRVF